mgnify:FL=1
MSISRITDLLEQMAVLHEELLELSERKKRALIENRINVLTEITGKETNRLQRIAELEQQRAEAVRRFYEEKGLKAPASANVTELSKLVFKAEEKSRLADARRKLLDLIDRLQAANALNRQLIGQALAFIEFSVDVLAGPPEPEAVYRHPAKQGYGRQTTALFDSKA